MGRTTSWHGSRCVGRVVNAAPPHRAIYVLAGPVAP
jgi:hypothetical protein